MIIDNDFGGFNLCYAGQCIVRNSGGFEDELFTNVSGLSLGLCLDSFLCSLISNTGYFQAIILLEAFNGRNNVFAVSTGSFAGVILEGSQSGLELGNVCTGEAVAQGVEIGTFNSLEP